MSIQREPCLINNTSEARHTLFIQGEQQCAFYNGAYTRFHFSTTVSSNTSLLYSSN